MENAKTWRDFDGNLIVEMGEQRWTFPPEVVKVEVLSNDPALHFRAAVVGRDAKGRMVVAIENRKSGRVEP